MPPETNWLAVSMDERALERGIREACRDSISALSVSFPLPSSTGESLESKVDSASVPSARFSARNASSKYDFVKVRHFFRFSSQVRDTRRVITSQFSVSFLFFFYTLGQSVAGGQC